MRTASDERSVLDHWPDIGLCPYCHSKLGEGRACGACGRDVDMLLELRREIEKLRQDDAGPRHRGPEEEQKSKTSLAWRLFSRAACAVLALLGADAAIQFVFDAQLVYLLAASFLIPLVFGYSLGIRRRAWREFGATLLAVAVASFAAVALMSLLAASLSTNGPGTTGSGVHKWKEELQFVVTIAFAFLAGISLAQVVRWTVADEDEPASEWLREWFLPHHFDHLPSHAQATKLKRVYAVLATVVSGALSLIGMLHGRLH